jgi:hypothetical protein
MLGLHEVTDPAEIRALEGHVAVGGGRGA